MEFDQELIATEIDEILKEELDAPFNTFKMADIISDAWSPAVTS